MPFQQSRRLFTGCFIVKFDTKDAFFKFPVVDDSNIFDINCIGCQNRSDGGDSAGLVGNIAKNAEGFLDQSAGTVGHGAAVIPRTAEHVVDCIVPGQSDLLPAAESVCNRLKSGKYSLCSVCRYAAT